MANPAPEPPAPPPTAESPWLPAEDEPAEASMEPASAPDGEPTPAPTQTPPDDFLVTQARTTRGLAWLAQVGWVIAVAGVGWIAYAYQWTDANDELHEVNGVSGVTIGAGVAALGLLLGVLFLLVPPRRAVRFDPNAPREAFENQARDLRVRAILFQAFSLVGIALLLIGLALTGLVYRQAFLDDPDSKEMVVTGQTRTYDDWARLALSVAGVGALLWIALAAATAGTRSAFRARVAAARAAPVIRSSEPPPAERAAGPESAPAVAETPPTAESKLPGGVQVEELQSLLKKLDALLGTMPDETVNAFSKTPEAETYLKLLGGTKEPPKQG